MPLNKVQPNRVNEPEGGADVARVGPHDQPPVVRLHAVEHAHAENLLRHEELRDVVVFAAEEAESAGHEEDDDGGGGDDAPHDEGRGLEGVRPHRPAASRRARFGFVYETAWFRGLHLKYLMGRNWRYSF